MTEHAEGVIQRADEEVAADLQKTIESIGLARFIGRINSGGIPTDLGNAAVERFIASEQSRPLLSVLSQTLFGRRDSYYD